MTDPIILHHYEISPFSEKIRRILAWKGMPWTSVRAPAVMPKPDLLALTGGYRKIPVMQIGNHVYCDSALIAREIERRCPTPSLYANPLAESLAEWADVYLFESLIPLLMKPSRVDDLVRLLTPDELQRMGEDRKAMRADSSRPPQSGKSLRAQFELYLKRIDAALGRASYVFGDAMSIADFSVYHGLWLVQKVAPDVLAQCKHTRAFLDRMSGIADPEVSVLTAEQAITLCRNAPAGWQPPAAFEDASGFSANQNLVVRANDYARDPVSGKLVFSASNEVVLRREDPRAGVVFVHFPRVGFVISAA
jgi:glutathione S-transferase